MQLEDDLRDCLAQIEIFIWRSDVESPSVSLILVRVWAEIKGNRAECYWEAGGGVIEADVHHCNGSGGCLLFCGFMRSQEHHR